MRPHLRPLSFLLCLCFPLLPFLFCGPFDKMSAASDSSNQTNTLSIRKLPSELLLNYGRELKRLAMTSSASGDVAHFVLFKSLASASLVFNGIEDAATTKSVLESQFPSIQVAFTKVCLD